MVDQVGSLRRSDVEAVIISDTFSSGGVVRRPTMTASPPGRPDYDGMIGAPSVEQSLKGL